MGRVERVDWKNPHTIVVVRQDDGATFTIDWNSLTALKRDAVLDSAKEALVFGVRVEVAGRSIRRADDSWKWTMRQNRTPDLQTAAADSRVDSASRIRSVEVLRREQPFDLPLDDGQKVLDLDEQQMRVVKQTDCLLEIFGRALERNDRRDIAQKGRVQIANGDPRRRDAVFNHLEAESIHLE